MGQPTASGLYNYIPTQAGGDPDHVPSASQVLTWLPEVRLSLYPESQVYVAASPLIWRVTLTIPLAGEDNLGHCTEIRQVHFNNLI